MFWWFCTQPNAKMIWYLDSAHQNSWKTLSFSNSYAHTHEKLITNQLYSSDKIMAQVKNTYCFMFDDLPLNQKQKWFDIWYSSDQIMVHVWKTLVIYCLKIFHSSKSKIDLIIRFTISKTVGKHSLLTIHILSPTKNYFQVILQQWQSHGSQVTRHSLFIVWHLALSKKQNWFDEWIHHIKTDEITCFQWFTLILHI